MQNAPSSQKMTLAQAFDHAVALYNAGQHQAALSLAEQLMAAAAPAPVVLNLAGAAARAAGQADKAERYWRAAITAQPDYASAHNNLALLLMEDGRREDAEAEFRKVLGLQADHVEALVNLGNLLRTDARQEESEACYRQALAIHPDHVDALFNLGLLLVETARRAEAEQAFRQCLAVRPRQADVLNDLGNLLADAQRTEEAEAVYRQAIEIAPEYADAHFNLGVLLLGAWRFADAFAAFRRAVEIQPTHANAINNLGNLFKETGRVAEAEAAYRRALEIRPDSANVHNNLGNLLMDAGRWDEAEAAFRQAVALQPDYGHALGQAVTCAQTLYSWGNWRRDTRSILDALEAGVEGIPALMVMTLPEAGGRHHRLAARLATMAKIQASQGLPALCDAAAHAAGYVPGARLRIGYLSADFREHAVMILFGGVLERHDRDRFEIHAYSTAMGAGPDPHRQRAEHACECFHDVRLMSDRALAERIAADRIDILVDLTGNTQNARMGVLAQRPAPLIVNWLGYPGTFGHPGLADYIIGDPHVTPLEYAEDFSETIAQMPYCYLPNDSARAIAATPTRAEEGLPEDVFVYCCFNQSAKLNPETFDIWCRLLSAVPGSVLWLSMAPEKAIANLRREAQARGVDPGRLIFAAKKPTPAEHLGRLRLADLALDTFPYTSHTTGCDALWAGVPLLTRMGETFVSRVAASLLHAVGLPELVTRNWDDYLALAVKLAEQPGQLVALRATLAANRLTQPLFDTERFTRDLERLYETMWARHLRGMRAPIAA